MPTKFWGNSCHLLNGHLYKVTCNQSPDGGFCIVFTRSIKPLAFFKRPLSISLRVLFNRPVDLYKVSIFTRGLLTSRLMEFECNTSSNTLVTRVLSSAVLVSSDPKHPATRKNYDKTFVTRDRVKVWGHCLCSPTSRLALATRTNYV